MPHEQARRVRRQALPAAHGRGTGFPVGRTDAP